MRHDFEAFRNLDWNLLRHLEALIEESSVSGAAERMSMTQPGMSRVLGRLRSVFQDELLVRGQRGMEPTARALTLLPQLQDLRQSVLDCVAPAEFEASSMSRTFVVAGADMAEHMILPPLVSALSQDAPHAKIRWLRAPHPAEEMLLSREIDLVIEPLSQKSAGGLLVQKLYSEEFCGLARKGHPSVSGKKMTLNRFCAAKHALVAPRGRPGGAVDRALQALGRQREVTALVPSFLSVPHLVAGSDLITTLPRGIAEAHIKTMNLQTFRLPLEVPGFTLGAFFHPRVRNEPEHQFLRERLKDSAESWRRQKTR